MKKRILAALCLLATLIAMGALTTNATDTHSNFKVGYSRVDINPYIDPTLTGAEKFSPSNLMPLPLRGSGDVWNRPSTCWVDDNADGVIDENDGLAVTCVAIQSDNKTILLITVDLIGSALVSQVRKEISSRLMLQYGMAIGADEIHYTGTHTHNAPDTTVVGNMLNSTESYTLTDKTGATYTFAYADMDAYLQTWIDRVITLVGDAAVEAVADLTPATVTKDQLQARTCTNFTMLSTRHYTSNKGYYYGDNFNPGITGTASNGVTQATKVDDTLYLVTLTPEDSAKKPVVLTGWRGHPTLNNSDSYENSSRNCISSDYVNSYRYALEKRGYRVAFFQGNGGNVNPTGREYNSALQDVGYAWINNTASKKADSRGNVYGKELSNLALTCLKDNVAPTVVNPGEIRTYQYIMKADRQIDQLSDLSYHACKASQLFYNSGKSGIFLYPSRVTNNNSLDFINWATAQGLDAQTYNEMIRTAEKYEKAGETYVVASKFHASSLVSKWVPSTADTAGYPRYTSQLSMELNAILLGDGLAFVTVPGEPFDYYDLAGSIAPKDNDWLELINNDTYGKPFVLGYCDGAIGYIPNAAAYDFNRGSKQYATGSYETQISPLAQGTGEKMIQTLKQMLQDMSQQNFFRSAYCAHCDSIKTWEPFSGGTSRSGHFYLKEDLQTAENTIDAGTEICLDLCGHTLTGDTRAFYLNGTDNTNGIAGAKLSIMDSSPGQTGVVRGSGSINGAFKGFNGGTVIVYSGAELNLYSGTLTMMQYPDGDSHSIRNGGVLLLRGTFNMYGGTITGGTASTWSGTYETTDTNGLPALAEKKAPGNGGNIYIDASSSGTGIFNMYGGTVADGRLQVDQNDLDIPVGVGSCIYARGYVNLYGDAEIANIYYAQGYGTNAPSVSNWLTVNGKYTGSVTLDPLSIARKDGDTVGKCSEDADISDAHIQIGSFVVEAKDSKLIIAPPTAFAIYTPDTESFTFCQSLEQALSMHKDSTTVIVLFEDLAQLDLRGVRHNVYLDLNGCDITGNVTVDPGWILFCMDSETDDYNASNRSGYGKLLGAVSGDVRPVEADTVGAMESSSRYKPGYVMLGQPGALSFHRLSIRLYTVALRPGEAGMYYTGKFRADEIVRANVKRCGIALSCSAVPTAENLESSCEYTVCDVSVFDKSTASVMLSGIMKSDNTPAANQENASMPVYGNAYVELENGYVFSEAVGISLQDLTQHIDARWTDLSAAQQAAGVEMYRSFLNIMNNWDIPNIKQYYTDSNANNG